jgi:hypothetical protein
LLPAPPVPTINGPFVLPSQEQMRKLLDIVTTRYPVLRGRECRITDDELFAEFQGAFRYVSSVHRTPGVIDAARSTEFWTNRAHEFARRRITLFAFEGAVIAAGAIANSCARAESARSWLNPYC